MKDMSENARTLKLDQSLDNKKQTEIWSTVTLWVVNYTKYLILFS